MRARNIGQATVGVLSLLVVIISAVQFATHPENRGPSVFIGILALIGVWAAFSLLVLFSRYR